MSLLCFVRHELNPEWDQSALSNKGISRPGGSQEVEAKKAGGKYSVLQLNKPMGNTHWRHLNLRGQLSNKWLPGPGGWHEGGGYETWRGSKHLMIIVEPTDGEQALEALQPTRSHLRNKRIPTPGGSHEGQSYETWMLTPHSGANRWGTRTGGTSTPEKSVEQLYLYIYMNIHDGKSLVLTKRYL